MATAVVKRGIQGPPGPGSVSPGAIITSRGDLIIGNASAVPARLAKGASGTYLRSNGTDPAYSAILAADLPAAIDAAKIANGLVSNTEFQYLDGVTSAIQTQFAGKAATTHAHTDKAERGIFIDHNAASSASVDNTASTSVWANAMDYTITLPTGTWTVRSIGGVALNHSAGATVAARVSVNGQDSTARVFAVTSSTLYVPVIDEDACSGLSGTVHVYIQFRSSSAGTTFAKNPWLWIVAERTA